MTNRRTPVEVSGLSGVARVGAGRDHSLAVKTTGTLVAWGSNNNGQLGDGTKVNRLTPVQVDGLTGVRAAAGGYDYTVALV